jgi:hypothetical protein
MLRMVPRGPDTYLLLAEGCRIAGWIRGRLLRFTGFESQGAAAAAALVGGRALVTCAGGAPLLVGPAAARPPNVDRASAGRVVPPRSADAAPVLEDVHACGSEGASGRAHAMKTYSVEFMLPGGLRADASCSIAQTVHAAVSLHVPRDRPSLANTRHNDYPYEAEKQPPPIIA